MSVVDLPVVARRPVAALVRRRSGLRELALIAALYAFYSVTRLFADGDLAAAQRHAGDVLHLERLAHVDVEARASAAVAAVGWVAVPASYWYAALHYVVTPVVLLLVYRRHRGDYARVRLALVVGSVLGLVGFLTFPTAPPRLMAGGYTDVLAQYAGWGWWSDSASVPAGLGGLSNQLAAMPSLHVGWALWVAWALWPHLARRGRVVAAL